MASHGLPDALSTIPADIYTPLLNIALQDHDPGLLEMWYRTMLQHVRKTASDNIRAAYGRGIAPISFVAPSSRRNRQRSLTSDEGSTTSHSSVHTPRHEPYGFNPEREAWRAAKEYAPPAQNQGDLMWRVASSSTASSSPMASQRCTPARGRSSSVQQMPEPSGWADEKPHAYTPSSTKRTYSQMSNDSTHHDPAYHPLDYGYGLPLAHESYSLFGLPEGHELENFDRVLPGTECHTALYDEPANGLGIELYYPTTETEGFSSPAPASARSSPPLKRQRSNLSA